jgi:hypothetical protein
MLLLGTFREWVRAHKETGLHATAILQGAEAEAEFEDKVLALQNAIGAEHRMLRTENEAARRFVKEAEGRVRDATEQAAEMRWRLEGANALAGRFQTARVASMAAARRCQALSHCFRRWRTDGAKAALRRVSDCAFENQEALHANALAQVALEAQQAEHRLTQDFDTELETRRMEWMGREFIKQENTKLKLEQAHSSQLTQLERAYSIQLAQTHEGHEQAAVDLVDRHERELARAQGQFTAVENQLRDHELRNGEADAVCRELAAQLQAQQDGHELELELLDREHTSAAAAQQASALAQLQVQQAGHELDREQASAAAAQQASALAQLQAQQAGHELELKLLDREHTSAAAAQQASALAQLQAQQDGHELELELLDREHASAAAAQQASALAQLQVQQAEHELDREHASAAAAHQASVLGRVRLQWQLAAARRMRTSALDVVLMLWRRHVSNLRALRWTIRKLGTLRGRCAVHAAFGRWGHAVELSAAAGRLSGALEARSAELARRRAAEKAVTDATAAGAADRLVAKHVRRSTSAVELAAVRDEHGAAVQALEERRAEMEAEAEWLMAQLTTLRREHAAQQQQFAEQEGVSSASQKREEQLAERAAAAERERVLESELVMMAEEHHAQLSLTATRSNVLHDAAHSGQEAMRRRRVIAAMANRLRHQTLSGSWSRWGFMVVRQRRADYVVRRMIAKLYRGSMASTVACWTQAVYDGQRGRAMAVRAREAQGRQLIMRRFVQWSRLYIKRQQASIYLKCKQGQQRIKELEVSVVAKDARAVAHVHVLGPGWRAPLPPGLSGETSTAKRARAAEERLEVVDAELRAMWEAQQEADAPPAARPPDAQVKKTPSWPRSWANFSLLYLYFHRNAWANLDLLGQSDTFLAGGGVLGEGVEARAHIKAGAAELRYGGARRAGQARHHP